MAKYKYLNDKEFLREIDHLHLQEQFLKIIVLDFEENPIQSIEGFATGGSLNIDGQSSMRRTCNLSLIATDETYNILDVNNLLSMNKKIQVELGIKNTTVHYSDYDIIWFPLGTFVIINPSISKSATGINISLTLKDKMCLLNGDCGGKFNAAIDLHVMDIINDKGEIEQYHPTIYEIIQSVVHVYGGEQLTKIIINDLDLRTKSYQQWRGESPLYLKKNSENNYYTATLNGANPSESDREYKYGKDIGYILTDFTYPGELSSKNGGTVVQILDNIKNILGNFEYFYDLDGNFIFQEIKNYINEGGSTEFDLTRILNEKIFLDRAGGKSVYDFSSNELVVSNSSTPQYQAIKNDFTIWGQRESATGEKMPIRYHLIMDKVPEYTGTYTVIFYTDDFNNIRARKPGAEEMGEEIIITEADDWRLGLYFKAVFSETLLQDALSIELLEEWPKVYNIQTREFIIDNIRDADYFLDIIDTNNPQIAQFNISNIGRRVEVIEDSAINCIVSPEVPDLVYIETGTSETAKLREECFDRNQPFVQVSSAIYNSMSVGGANSAFEYIRGQLYTYLTYNESINISTMPIYYLEPNTRITINDKDTSISGDYMIRTISLPLDINGQMSLSCTKALERL